MKQLLLLFVLPLFAFGMLHKFYVSVTQVTYSAKEESLQITSRIFIDDMDLLLKERYGLVARLASDQESERADDFIEKYFRSKFVVRVNGQVAGFSFLGKRYDNDILVCYLEIPKTPLNSINSLEVQNELLTDIFDDQKNIVHMAIGSVKRSFVMVKENNKGMLNL